MHTPNSRRGICGYVLHVRKLSQSLHPGRMDSTNSPPASPRQLRLGGTQLRVVGEGLSILQEFRKKLELTVTAEDTQCRVTFHDGSKRVFEVKVREEGQVYQAESTLVFLRISQGSAVITLATQNDTSQLVNHLCSILNPHPRKLKKQSTFSLRTEESSAKQYFLFYGYLSQQQNMLQDYIRTATYQSAMLQNATDFQDKVVLDVGAGTGILSFFAIKAGARKVYSIEASSMAVHCLELVKSNRYSDKMEVIAGKLEEVEIPEKVDVIISEPMGYMLFNERMVESFLHAKKWLRPEGKMFPTQGILYCAPFTDDMLYMEQLGKANFWYQQSFYGVDLSALRGAAVEEYLRQPILDTFDVRILMAKPIGHTTDFMKSEESDLHDIFFPLKFKLWSTGTIHGLAFWFDVAFIGSQATIWLSTAPFQPLTHWYQIRCLLRNPIFVRVGQELVGMVHMVANERQSYDVDIEVSVPGTAIRSTNSYDLKNPNFRYMGSVPSPPGIYHNSPTETYWDSQQHQVLPHASTMSAFTPTSQDAGQTLLGYRSPEQSIPVVNGGMLSPLAHTHVHSQVPLAVQSLTVQSLPPHNMLHMARIHHHAAMDPALHANLHPMQGVSIGSGVGSNPFLLGGRVTRNMHQKGHSSAYSMVQPQPGVFHSGTQS